MVTLVCSSRASFSSSVQPSSNASRATLPVTCWIVGGALSTMLASLHMKRAGRQRGFISGAFWSIGGALVCAAAVWERGFWTLCAGSLLMGVANAYAQYYRFAAADA